MLNEACLRFREGFEPGRPEGHTAACGACRIWVREVKALRTLRADVPLPLSLRGRLKVLCRQEAGAGAGALLIAGPLPQVPLPSALMAELYRIPSATRLGSSRRPAAGRSGEMIAASLFFATVLTLGLGNFGSLGTHPAFSTASRVTGMVLKEAGSRGTQTLLGVGERIFAGCLLANRSLETLLDRIAEPRREASERPPTPKAAPDTPSRTPSTQEKEKAHGSRPTH